MKKFEILNRGTCLSAKNAKLVKNVKEGQFQSQLWQSDELGWMLVEDGLLRYSQQDALIYNEMLAHSIMHSHHQPLNILVIGAADGMLVENILKHNIVRRLDWVINQKATWSMCEENKTIAAIKKLDKVNISMETPLDFLRSGPKPYDVVFSEVSLAKTDQLLRTHDYYQVVAKLIKPGGIAVFQSGMTFFDQKVIATQSKMVAEHFHSSGKMALMQNFSVGGLKSWMWASAHDISEVNVGLIAKRLEISPIHCEYYSPERHKLLFNQSTECVAAGDITESSEEI